LPATLLPRAGARLPARTTRPRARRARARPPSPGCRQARWRAIRPGDGAPAAGSRTRAAGRARLARLGEADHDHILL